ncbi:MAG: c-type cytochrome [Sedimenticola sp.]
MTTNKTLIAALGAISVSLLAGPVLALDAAGLYVERACIACHGAEGRVPAMDEYPKLAGQKAPYMLAQMKDIKSGTRTNSHSMAMKSMMYMISDEEMTTVSDWLGGLPEKAPAMSVVSSASAEDAPAPGSQLFVAKACSSCHGPDGRTPIMPIYPKVAGQSAGYTYNQLRDTKDGSRGNGQAMVMRGIMAGVTEPEMRTIADWLATQ